MGFMQLCVMMRPHGDRREQHTLLPFLLSTYLFLFFFLFVLKKRVNFFRLNKYIFIPYIYFFKKIAYLWLFYHPLFLFELKILPPFFKQFKIILLI